VVEVSETTLQIQYGWRTAPAHTDTFADGNNTS